MIKPSPASARYGHAAARAQPQRGNPRMLAEVAEGLALRQKELPPKYFYDQRGSELFEAITRLPEYYQTRTERALLEKERGELAAAPDQELAELIGVGIEIDGRTGDEFDGDAGFEGDGAADGVLEGSGNFRGLGEAGETGVGVEEAGEGFGAAFDDAESGGGVGTPVGG